MTASPTSFPRLLADVGGTHARFARQTGAGRSLQDIITYKCADFPSLQAVMERYIAQHSLLERNRLQIGNVLAERHFIVRTPVEIFEQEVR